MIGVPERFSILKNSISFKYFAKTATTENTHLFLYAHSGFEQRQDSLFMESIKQTCCSYCAQPQIFRKGGKEQNDYPQLPEIHSLGKI